ncbi:MAG TPA: type I methionyl aminopeptidase [Acidobacteriota bacterium]|nr:type I methionyl aminopeptidase [Acidobacteriota bacterium]
MIEYKSTAELDCMYAANQIVATVRDELAARVAPGVSTAELDEYAEARVRELGGEPAFKGYRGFPATVCASLNEEIVHGIPSPTRRLAPGDILGLDLGVRLDGFYGDSAITVPVPPLEPEVSRLLDVTAEALDCAIEQCTVGNRIGDISNAVQQHVESAGFSVVREFVGHGIGASLHEDPQIPNFGAPGVGVRLRPGMVLAIEPMVNLGAAPVEVLDDGWTAVTVDRKPSAHFEHSVAITDGAPWVLSASGAREMARVASR